MHENGMLLVNWRGENNKLWFNVKVKLVKKGSNMHGLHWVVLLDDDAQVYKFRIVKRYEVGIHAVVPGFLPTAGTTPRPSGTPVHNLVLHTGSKIRCMDPSVQPGEKTIGIYSCIVVELKQNKIRAFYLKDDIKHYFDWFEHRHVTGMMKEGWENDVKKTANPSYVHPVVVPPHLVEE